MPTYIAHSPRSIESRARMAPSTVRPTAKPKQVRCGCCRRRWPASERSHPVLGPLCIDCQFLFDYTVDCAGEPLPPACNACWEAADKCERHMIP